MARYKMRSEETRPMETRRLRESYEDAERAISMNYQYSLYIDPKMVPPDLEYYWARETIKKTGEYPDETRIAELNRFGWDIVPVECHPELATPDPMNRFPHLRGCIHRNGCVLMSRPKYLSDRQKNQWTADSEAAMKGANQFTDAPLGPLKVNQELSKSHESSW